MLMMMRTRQAQAKNLLKKQPAMKKQINKMQRASFVVRR